MDFGHVTPARGAGPRAGTAESTEDAIARSRADTGAVPSPPQAAAAGGHTPAAAWAEGLRPCDFCDHPVVVDSVDERDCPVCGESA